MLKNLRRRLTLFYAGTTSLILTVILLLTWLYQGHLESARQESLFQNYLLELTNKLETDTHFSDEWLARMEADNGLIIHIEENSVPLFFPGSWTPATDRKVLIQSAKNLAMEQTVDTSHPPFFQYMKKTAMLDMKGNHEDRYNGMVLVLPSAKSYKTLILLQDITADRKNYLYQGLLFLFVDVLGSFLLYLICRYILKKAMQPISDYQHKQTEFVAAASHELRSPLSVIQTSAAALVQSPENAPVMAQSIQRECSRAGRLIKDLLLLASADSGAALRELTPVEADSILLQLYESFEPLCRDKGISLQLRMPQKLLPEVRSDSGYLYQILSILIDNALEYGCPPASLDFVPTILLAADFSDHQVILSVIDHGPGIPEGEKENIFLRFSRADTSRNQKDHFGLGLSIAEKLSPLAGAHLILSDTPGGGASFSLWLDPA